MFFASLAAHLRQSGTAFRCLAAAAAAPCAAAADRAPLLRFVGSWFSINSHVWSKVVFLRRLFVLQLPLGFDYL